MQADAVGLPVLATDFRNLDVVGIIDETARDEFEEVFHARARVRRF